MKEGQPKQKPNDLRHMDNFSHAMDYTVYHGKTIIHGEVQIPLTHEQRKVRRQQRGR